MGRGLPWLLLAAAAGATPLDLPPGGFRVELVETSTAPGRIEYLLRFPSALKSPWPANDWVWAHLSVPDQPTGRRPAVLVLPVMAAPNVWIETCFVERFIEEGLVTMWIEMPTQFRRRPHPSMPSGQVFLARSASRLAANFRQSVLDARRALTVLCARPEVDAGRVALFGVSLGALVAASAYSVDPRPRYAAFLLGGAGFPELVLDGSLTGPTARRLDLRPEQLRAAWAGLDPLDHKDLAAAKRALLVNALWDRVIPRANALRLQEAFPSARQLWLPLGHYSSIVHLLWLPRWTARRLAEELAGKKTIKGPQAP